LGLGVGVRASILAARILRRYQEVVDELQRDAAPRMDGLLGG
jgi:hypothetical protein